MFAVCDVVMGTFEHQTGSNFVVAPTATTDLTPNNNQTDIVFIINDAVIVINNVDNQPTEFDLQYQQRQQQQQTIMTTTTRNRNDGNSDNKGKNLTVD